DRRYPLRGPDPHGRHGRGVGLRPVAVAAPPGDAGEGHQRSLPRRERRAGRGAVDRTASGDPRWHPGGRRHPLPEPVPQYRARDAGLDHGRRFRALPGRPDVLAPAADQHRGPGHLALWRRQPRAHDPGAGALRPARALIDLGALRHNERLARRLGGGRALAVGKADAYGHGAAACARALEGEADGFAVAAIEEALELREAGITAPVLLLEGFFEAAELELIDRHRLWTVVQAPWQVEAIERFRPSAPLRAWVKLDSGMHRLGLSPDGFADAWKRLRA